jgi:3-oxoacyl-[acyl-carrier protein] reductase
MFELTGCAAIVTGGARGIGRAIALALANAGADVLITYKGNTAAAEAVVAEIMATGRTGAAIQADAADPDAAVAVTTAAMERFGKVDILVNNAGITRDTLILRMTPEQWREVLDTNLSGAFYMTKAVVKEMLRAKSGRIINITSVSGQAGNAGQANYSSAKAGMIGLTKATAREVASRGITVNAVAPGFIVTELTADLPDAIKEGVKAQTPLGRFGEPAEIAAAVLYLASSEASYVTGQVLGVDGGLVMM